MTAPIEPSRTAALARLAAVDATAYARSRNHLQGAVTGLSPYLTHGLLTLPECLAALGLPRQHKLVFEFGWREFFRHVWAHQGDRILDSLHPGPLPESAYTPTLPDDVRRGATGVPVIDQAVRTLYATGTLHNHARMWLAAYVVHGRKCHWRAGADWLYGHLLDGDLASNHLSWQWVAATGSHKPYIFDAANVARYAPREWHSEGSAVDLSYDAWDALARRPQALPAGLSPDVDAPGLDEPAFSPVPAWGETPRVLDPETPVWLAHPWALGDPPPGRRVVGIVIREAHAAQPWSPRRWDWVGQRLAAIADTVWVGPARDVAAAVASARQVASQANPHIDRWLPPGIDVAPEPRGFTIADRPCTSFSQWWRRVTVADEPADLAGLMRP